MSKLLLGAAVAATVMSAAPAMAGCKFNYYALNATGYEIKVTKLETAVWNDRKNKFTNVKRRNIKDFTIAPGSGEVAKDQQVARTKNKKIHLFFTYDVTDSNAPANVRGERTAQFYGPGISCNDTRSAGNRPKIWFN